VLVKKNQGSRLHAPDTVPGKACPRVWSGVRRAASQAPDANHSRQEPYALKCAHTICAGGEEQSPSLPRLRVVTDSVKYFGPLDAATYAELAPIPFKHWYTLVPATMSSQSRRRFRRILSSLAVGPCFHGPRCICQVLAPIADETRSPAGRTSLARALPRAFVFSRQRGPRHNPTHAAGIPDIPNEPSPIFGHATPALLARNSRARHPSVLSAFIGVYRRPISMYPS
jgi:hypothetical protein